MFPNRLKLGLVMKTMLDYRKTKKYMRHIGDQLASPSEQGSTKAVYRSGKSNVRSTTVCTGKCHTFSNTSNIPGKKNPT